MPTSVPARRAWGLCPQTPRIFRLAGEGSLGYNSLAAEEDRAPVGTDPSTSAVAGQQGTIRPKRSSPLSFEGAALASKAINPRGSGGLVPQSVEYKML